MTPEVPHESQAAALLAAIVDSADDVIISKTLEGTITYWNRAAARIFGYTAEEAVGRNIKLIIPTDLHPEEDEILTRLRRGEKIDHFQTIRQTKDGRRIDISLAVSPIRDASGNVIGASKVARDISLQKRVEGEREEALARAEAAYRQVQEADRAKDLLDRALVRAQHGHASAVVFKFGVRLDRYSISTPTTSFLSL